MEDRQGITEIRHIEGYFSYWDGLLKDHPGMLVDSCASGGRRNDLETLRRAVPMLRSDYYHSPHGQQCQTYGLSFWFPYQGTGIAYNREMMTEYWIRSSWVTEFSLGPGVEGLEIVDFKQLKKLTDEWRSIAHYFFGDYYPLTPYSLENNIWMAWQFNRPDLGEGVIQAFRRPDCFYESACLKLKGLEPDGSYVINRSNEKDLGSIAGRELMEKGLIINLKNVPDSATIIYKKLK